jgi:hypothetical protein
MSDASRFQIRTDIFGIYVLDNWYKSAVRDGKGNVVRRPEWQRPEIQEICDEMNARTAGIPFDSDNFEMAA